MSTKMSIEIRWTSSAKITDDRGKDLSRGDYGVLEEERANILSRLGFCRITGNLAGGDPDLAGVAGVEARADDVTSESEGE